MVKIQLRQLQLVIVQRLVKSLYLALTANYMIVNINVDLMCSYPHSHAGFEAATKNLSAPRLLRISNSSLLMAV